MKRSIILLLVLLPIFAFSQMQHIISQGNTATTKRQISANTIIDSNIIKVRNINKDTLISSIPSNSNFLTTLVLSTLGTNVTTQTIIPSVKIYDLKIFKDYIYFCGSYNGLCGFIAWANIADLFSQNPSPITIQLMNNPIAIPEITKLEVYDLGGDIQIAALSSNNCLIRLNTINPANYQMMFSLYTFKNLSVGYKKIATIEEIDDSTMIVSLFEAIDIQNYTGGYFSHPMSVYDNYVLENSKINADIFTLAYTHLKNTSSSVTYKTDFITFDDNLNIINQQYLEDPHAKLDPIDLEYCIEDNKLLYLTTGRSAGDVVFTVDPFATQGYISRAIQPTIQIFPSIKQYYSIIRYDDYYFATLGVDPSLNSLILFDCKRNSSSVANCANIYNVNVHNCNHFNMASGSPVYTFSVGVQNTAILNPKTHESKYILNCN